MSVVVVLPVKRFELAKQRLGDGGLRRSDRVALATGMLTDVLETLRLTRNIDDIVVVTSEPGAEVLARTYGAQVVTDDDADGHSAAAAIGIAWALAEGAFHVLVLAGDAPTVAADELDELVGALSDGPEVVIVPDRHGTGTNALLLTPPDVIAPSFGAASRERHEQLAHAAGATVRVSELASLMLDVDTPDDLDALAGALADAPRRTAVYTRDALSRVRRG
jgi:2-phospho-L-lactate guanylyltransferase